MHEFQLEITLLFHALNYDSRRYIPEGADYDVNARDRNR